MPGLSRHIHLWSSPRNVSTALMYAFAQRRDTAVRDEPLYAAYLHRFPEIEHPGREDILHSQPQDARIAIGQWYRQQEKPVVVYKQMTHHLRELDWSFLLKDGLEHVLLIRDPDYIIASYGKVIDHPTMSDIGVALQAKLFDYLEAHGRLAAIVDAMELLKDPESILKQLCSRLDLAFDINMLSWPAGPRPEDGVWARYWYARVHASTGFLPFQPRPPRLKPEWQVLASRCRPYYDRLYQMSIKAD